MDNTEIRMKCLEIVTRDWAISDVEVATLTASVLAAFVISGEVYATKASEPQKMETKASAVN